MSFTFRPARRDGVGLFIGVAGASGSGKTYSALRMAKGIAGPAGKVAAIDTEARRMSHYSDQFAFDVADMAPPFRPERFADAAKDAEAAGYAVLVIDSFSMEWTGEGGVLSWHDEELDRLAGDDMAKRERVKMAAWIKPKMAHKAMIGSFLQRRMPIIFCLRAEDKVGVGAGGKPVSLGWTPIGDARFLFELTASVTLAPDAPGKVSYQLPHKIQQQHRRFLPHDEAITEEAGAAMAEWARGGDAAPAADPLATLPPKARTQATKLLEEIAAVADEAGMLALTARAQPLRDWFRQAQPAASAIIEARFAAAFEQHMQPPPDMPDEQVAA